MPLLISGMPVALQCETCLVAPSVKRRVLFGANEKIFTAARKQHELILLALLRYSSNRW